MKAKEQRLSNIELLRVVLMLMIITHHVVLYGFRLIELETGNYSKSTSSYILLFVESFAVLGVNTFVFISGYFGIKFRLKNIAYFLGQALFYSITLYLLFSFVRGSWILQPYIFFPISTGFWWFFTAYIGLYIVSPFLNKGFEYLNRSQIIILVGCLIFFDCFSGFFYTALSENGYSVFHFITVYALARLIRKEELKIKRPTVCLITLTLLTFILSVSLLEKNYFIILWKFLSYNNPLLLLSSIFLFYSFYNLNIGYKKYINVIATTVFGIYLIHDYPRCRELIFKIINSFPKDNVVLYLLLIVFLILGIFTIGTIIELIRKKTMEPLIEKVSIWFNTNIIERRKNSQS